MRVNHVRLPSELAAHFERRAAEKDKALGIVGVHVDAVARIEARVLDEIDGHICANRPLQNGCLLRVRVQRHVECRNYFAEAELRARDGAVARQRHTHIDAEFFQCQW